MLQHGLPAVDDQCVTGAEPLQRLAAMGRAYRTTALANRSYYAVMFQRPIPGFEPSPEAYQERES